MRVLAEALPPHHDQLIAAGATGWKSPVPYLFGGLAAMLGLIAFALLILACSYWKLSGYLDPAAGDSEDAGAGKGGDDGGVKDKGEGGEEWGSHIVVFVGGKPCFLATPATASRASSGGDGSGIHGGGGGGGGGGERREKEVELTTGDTPDEGKS